MNNNFFNLDNKEEVENNLLEEQFYNQSMMTEKFKETKTILLQRLKNLEKISKENKLKSIEILKNRKDNTFFSKNNQCKFIYENKKIIINH